ncbi:MAG TPA: MFS transporter [Ktedonobacteraceae bacterium]|nr:MFS transporter [Ktedonobacteraceae bacterium]
MAFSRTEKRRRGFVLALLCVAQFMVVLDFSIVNIALPSMQKDLGLSTQNLQWIVSAYSLTFGGFLMLGGRMGDLYGRRKLFMLGLLLFSLSSLAGGLAFSGIWLITTRAIQGLGAALIAPSCLSLITVTFAEGEERNKAFGMIGSIASFGFAAGAILGGLLTAGPGWRWVMFVNVPIGCVAFALAPFLLAESRVHSEKRQLDVPGAVLITAAVVALVYALAQGNQWGWISPSILALLALSVILLAAFVVVELRAPSPLMDLSIFRQRTVTGANLINLLAPGSFGAFVFVLTLFMQKVLGYSAIEMGLAFLPLALVILVFSNASSRLVMRLGARRLLITGLVITVIGFVLFLGLSATGAYASTLLPGLLVIGLGMGCVFSTVVIVATDGVSDEQQGLVSGLFNTTMQVGSGLALAIIVAISSGRTTVLLQGREAMKVALTGGTLSALIACAAFDALAALVAIFVLRGKPARPSSDLVFVHEEVESRQATGSLAR